MGVKRCRQLLTFISRVPLLVLKVKRGVLGAADGAALVGVEDTKRPVDQHCARLAAQLGMQRCSDLCVRVCTESTSSESALAASGIVPRCRRPD